MYNEKLICEVKQTIAELKKSVKDIINSSKNCDEASNRITKIVSSRMAAEVEGYVVSLYADLVDRVENDDFFKDPNHLNAFYRLRLRETINEKYCFDIKSTNAYKEGIQYDEIKSIYSAVAESAGVALGTASLGSVLKYTVIHKVTIPIVILIAAAVGAVFYFSYENNHRKKKDYQKAVEAYLTQMENDILDWLTEVDLYFEEQVRALYLSK